jgi:tRNA pseudouridine-54 N-methylase
VREDKMSLYFLLTSSTIRSKTEKTIKSVAGGQERVDVVSRCLLNLYRCQRRINREIHLILFLSHPDEQSVINIPLSSIKSKLESELDSVRELLLLLSDPSEYNLTFEKTLFVDLLENLAKESDFYYFTPEGRLIEEYENTFKNEKPICFVLGSQHDLTEEQERILYKYGASPVSIGEKDYLASHVITIACYYFSHLIFV